MSEPARAASVEPTDHDDRSGAIGTVRAVASGVLIVLAGFVGVILVPNLVVAGSFPSSRDARSLTATAMALTWVVVLAWVVRRLQARGLI